MTDLVEEFMGLFVGNARSFGQLFPEDGKMLTVKAAYTANNFRLHLQGKVGIGVVPILDDGTCRFAAIDIDAHGENDISIDVGSLSSRVEQKNLPLMVCKSKGRGAHLYLFFSEPVPASAARNTLQRWAQELNYGGVEIFPKQAALPVDKVTNQRAFGHWINLPYFGGDTRTAFEGGKELELGYFIESARNRSINAEEFASISMSDHAHAPPCIQRMLQEGVAGGEGLSNRALYNATIYFKRAFPDDYRDRARDFNATILKKPQDRADREKTIRSASSRDYLYKCKEEPIKSLCDRVTCLTRKFGIAAGDDDDLATVDFGALLKLDSAPPRWQLSANGIPMDFTTNELHAFAHVRARVWEVHHFWIKEKTKKEWERELTEMGKKVQVIEAPEDVSRPGMVRARLMQYLNKAGPDNGEDGRQRFGGSTKPAPTWITYEGKEMPAGRYVIFDFGEFKEFLRKNRSDDVREGVDLHMILKFHCECRSIRIKIGPQPRTVHSISASSVQKFEGAASIPEAEL